MAQTIEEERQLHICLEWLHDRELTKNVNKKVTTLNIKQAIEQDLKTYVSKPIVLEAVQLLRINHVKDSAYSDLVYVSISRKEINPIYRKRNRINHTVDSND